MIYYLFILDVNFLKITAVPDIDMINRINPANKILISSLILFLLDPNSVKQISYSSLQKFNSCK